MMKKVILLLLPLLFFTCNDDPDCLPVSLQINCTFLKTKLQENIKIIFECLEKPKQDAVFDVWGNYTWYRPKKSIVLLPKEDVLNADEDEFVLSLSPYAINGIIREKQDELEGTELTYVLHIYEGEKLLLKKQYKFPMERSSLYDKIDL